MTGYYYDNSLRINFDRSTMGYFQNALQSAGTAELQIEFPDGRSYLFTIPDSDYMLLWSVASDYWYIPTYNDDLYQGTGVNPDLVTFFEAFYPKIQYYFELAKSSDARFASEQMKRYIESDASASEMYGKYQLLHEHAPVRTVDYEYYIQYANHIDGMIQAQDIQDGLTYSGDLIDSAGDLSGVVHGLFGDSFGNDYDTTVQIMDGILGLFGY